MVRTRRVFGLVCGAGYYSQLSYFLIGSVFMLRAYLLSPWLHFSLCWQLVRREILGRYRGSVLGVSWVFFGPLMMLAVYTFVFSSVFKSRWPGSVADGGIDFALRLFAGLMVFNLFSEVCTRAPSLVVEQPNLVKKVAFPLETLPFVCLGAALFGYFVNFAILLTVVLLFDPSGLSWASLVSPLIVLPMLPFLLGLAWVLSAVGVYIRDLGTVVGMLVTILMFLSPVFYSLSSLPEAYRSWLQWSPLAAVIEAMRALLFGGIVYWEALGSVLLLGVLTAVVGAVMFSTLRRGFSDVV